jgi:peptidoglycan L-alanyl-D-glutamate endopeptidase CwlK
MTLSTSTPGPRDSYSYTELCRDPSLEKVAIEKLSFLALTKNTEDLRAIIPGLASYAVPIHPRDVIVDSDMSLSEAFKNLSKDCPDEILVRQQLLRVFYFGADEKLHQGQVVVHEELAQDVSDLFKMIVQHRLPIGSVIPMSAPQFSVREYSARGVFDTRWDDCRSMEADNSSAFNYRRIVTPSGEKKTLSLHGLGMALDINPAHNPCYGDPLFHDKVTFSKEAAAGYRGKLPSNGIYDPEDSATMTSRHQIVQFLTERGWTWGGSWGDPLDYHHFQKVPEHLKAEVDALRKA